MFRSVEIKNFRCFKNVELHDLSTVNLLVGKNGTGKTAFLEALYLACGGATELALRIRAWRGMLMPTDLSLDRQTFEGLWSDLFFHFDLNTPICIAGIDSHNERRSLVIAFKENGELLLPVGKE